MFTKLIFLFLLYQSYLVQCQNVTQETPSTTSPTSSSISSGSSSSSSSSGSASSSRLNSEDVLKEVIKASNLNYTVWLDEENKKCAEKNQEFRKCSENPREICMFNKIYTGNLCNELRRNMRPRPRFCVTGCYCKEGEIYDAFHFHNGKCFPKEDCFNGKLTTNLNTFEFASIPQFKSRCTGENEIYHACGGCPTICENNKITSPNFCKKSKLCEPGCRCIYGYIYNSEGKCIPEAECQNGKN